MPSADDIQSQRDLLAAYRRRLSDQLIQLARQGEAHAPPGLLADIREAREQITRVKTILRDWGVAVEDLPDDADPHAAPRPRVFISYKHDGAPDASLAAELASALRAGCDVFIDTELPVGARWAEQIKAELDRADVLIALMSARAAESEMVREEIAIAHALNQAHGHPRILRCAWPTARRSHTR